MIDKTALTLIIIGALNLGSIGLFGFDVLGYIFGGQMSTVSRVVYTLIGLSGVWCVSLLFRNVDLTEEV